MTTQENSDIIFSVEDNNTENSNFNCQNFRSDIEFEHVLSELSNILQRESDTITFTRKNNLIDIKINSEIKKNFSTSFLNKSFKQHFQSTSSKKKKQTMKIFLRLQVITMKN